MSEQARHVVPLKALDSLSFREGWYDTLRAEVRSRILIASISIVIVAARYTALNNLRELLMTTCKSLSCVNFHLVLQVIIDLRQVFLGGVRICILVL